MPAVPQPVGVSPKNRASTLVPLAVVMSLMFVWNISRNVNDVLVPHLRRACQLTDFQSSLVQSAFFGAYFLMALPVGAFLRRYGYKAGMLAGLLTATAGGLLFYPAAETRLYPVFLLALFVMAAGFTFLEVTATPYVSVLGPPEGASSRLSLAAALGSLGSTLGPVVGAAWILPEKDVNPAAVAALSPAELNAYLNREASLVKGPYLALAGVFLVLGAVVFFAKLPVVREEGERTGRLTDVFRFRHTVLGALGVFCYLGAEVGIVSFMIRYAKALRLPGVSEQGAAVFISYFMAGVLAGRLAGAALLRRYDPARTLLVTTLAAFACVLASVLTTGYVAIGALVAVGLCTSVMYPILFTLSIKGLGPYTKTGSSLLIMSIVGGAVVPPLMGLVSDAYGLRLAYAVPLLCYAYVSWYAVRGHRVETGR